ncbi:MAG: hypothetical protein WA057_02375 [Candidatus Magasanikiibacteriota bacterium]
MKQILKSADEISSYLIIIFLWIIIGRTFWILFPWLRNIEFIFFVLPFILCIFVVTPILLSKKFKNTKIILWCKNNKNVIRIYKLLCVILIWFATTYLISIFFGIEKGISIATFVGVFTWLFNYHGWGSNFLDIEKNNFIIKFGRSLVILGLILLMTYVINFFILPFLLPLQWLLIY